MVCLLAIESGPYVLSLLPLTFSSTLLPINNPQGENARMSSFIGAIAIADLVKTTLGPKGMDKILQSVGSPDGAVTVGGGGRGREGGREGGGVEGMKMTLIE